MSESKQKELREKMMQEQAAKEKANREAHKAKVLQSIRDNFTKVEVLIKDKAAHRALIYIRKLIREQSRQVQEEINQEGTDIRRTDFLRGKLEGMFMAFNVVSNARELWGRLAKHGDDATYDSLIRKPKH